MRFTSFTHPLTPTIRKYLDIRSTTYSDSRANSRPPSALSMHSASSNVNTRAVVAPTRSTNSGTSASKPLSSSQQVDAFPGTNLNRQAIRQQRLVEALNVATPREEAHKVLSARSTSIAGPGAPSSLNLHISKSSSMRPPESIPLRGPLQSVEVQECKAESSLASSTQRVKSGPLRPEGLTESMLAADKVSQREVIRKPPGGARRVLRPEPPQPELEKPLTAKKPIRPESYHSATYREGDTTAEPDSETNLQAQNRHSAVFTVGSKAESFKPSGIQPSILQAPEARLERAKTKKRPKDDGKQVVTGSRITRPTLSQMARAKLILADQKQSTTSSKDLVKPKAQTKSFLLKNQGLTGSHTCEDDDRAEKQEECIRPASIPLPPSPLEHETEEQGTLEARPIDGLQHCSDPAIPAGCSHASAPATPTATAPSPQATAVQQTPISALLDSIRSGFGLSEDTNAKDARSDDGRHFVDGSVHVSPLCWVRKNPRVVQ